jgi:hypothetical protein
MKQVLKISAVTSFTVSYDYKMLPNASKLLIQVKLNHLTFLSFSHSLNRSLLKAFYLLMFSLLEIIFALGVYLRIEDFDHFIRFHLGLFSSLYINNLDSSGYIDHPCST